MGKKFKQYTANISIIVKNSLVKAHDSIGMVKYYHGLLRQIYFIITTKIPSIELDLALETFFKATNDSIGPNELVPTLLIFGAYSKMTE